jgi:hypothetical protein
MPKTKIATAVPIDQIGRSIVIVRGHKVLLDAELAALYGVTTKVLIQAVKRNIERFPGDFMLSLTTGEWQGLRSQFVTSNPQRGGRRYPELARQFANLETRLNKKLADHDKSIAAILSAIRQLMNPPPPKRRGIGFTAKI